MIRWVEGIVQRDGRVLICKLKKRNPLIPRIQWTFPFTEILEEESPRVLIKNLFKKELKMDVQVKRVLLKYVPSENAKVEQIFYELCPKIGNPCPSRNFSDFTWVKPTQVLKYFTTSMSMELMDYLRTLENTGTGIILD